MAYCSRATINPSAASYRGTARMMVRLPALALGAALSSLALAASTAGARAEDTLGGERAGPVALTAAQMDAVTIAPIGVAADAAPAGLSPMLLSELLQQVDRLATDPFVAGAVGPCPNGSSGASTVCVYPDRGGLPLTAVAVTDSEPLAERLRAETAPAAGPAVPAASSLAATAPTRPPSRSPWTAAAAPPTEAVAAITARSTTDPARLGRPPRPDAALSPAPPPRGGALNALRSAPRASVAEGPPVTRRVMTLAPTGRRPMHRRSGPGMRISMAERVWSAGEFVPGAVPDLPKRFGPRRAEREP